jgi:hypothetical protein
MFKVDFKEKIRTMAGHENVLYTLTESGLIYSWGHYNKRITRSCCDTNAPHLVKITERSDRKYVDVKFDRFMLHTMAIDVCGRTWTLRNGVWRKTKIVAADSAPTQVQFVGFK